MSSTTLMGPNPVYVLSAEFSAPIDDESPKGVFLPAGQADPEATLLTLMHRAGARALRATDLDAQLRDNVDYLLVTTMPSIRGGGSDLVLPKEPMNLTSELKRMLSLGLQCQPRFEIGSSDAGAALAASALHLLRGLSRPATAMVIAGQVMSGGLDAIETIAQVVDKEERRLGLRMIPVGDMLLDALWWASSRAGSDTPRTLRFPDRAPDAEPGDETGFRMVRDATALADEITRYKLALGTEYRAGQRDSTTPIARDPMARWLCKGHMASASVGACAVVLTTDEDLVRTWVARGTHNRIVRILGVGEGDDNAAIRDRTEPFLFAKSVRQALAALRIGYSDLQSCAFAVLHDAFPSIEMAFLLGLGFSPLEAIERAVSYWPNPYGGLTAFGHALAASGLVQIAKAFQIFTRPDAYLPRSAASTRHPDYTRTSAPVHCLTTSVGGPLTHIVATWLESCPVDPAIPALPRSRMLAERQLAWLGAPTGYATFESKCAWLAGQMARYQARCAEVASESAGRDAPGDGGQHGLGVVEGRTVFDLRQIELPLPAEFVDGWRPLESPTGQPGAQALLPESLRDLLTGRAQVEAEVEVDDDDERTLRKRISREIENLARQSRRDDGVEDVAGSSDGSSAAGLKARKRAVWNALRVPVALVSGGGPGLEKPHEYCLMRDPDLPVGSLVEVAATGGGWPVIVGEREGAPGLVPPWYTATGSGDRVYLSGDERARSIITALLHGDDSAPVWRGLHELVGEVLAQVRTDWHVAPSRSAVRLVQELVFDPEPNRWLLGHELAAVCGLERSELEPVQPELVAYCEFNVVRATTLGLQELPRVFDRLWDGITRAKGWLSGANVHVSQVTDTFTIVARMKRDVPGVEECDESDLWPQVIRFAKEVYQRLRMQDIKVRAVVSVARGGVPLYRKGEYRSLAGGAQAGAHLAMKLLPEFHRRRHGTDPGEHGSGEGVAVIVHGDQARDRSLEELAGQSEQHWLQAGGVSLERVNRDWLTADSFCCFYDVRRLPDGSASGLKAGPESGSGSGDANVVTMQPSAPGRRD